MVFAARSVPRLPSDRARRTFALGFRVIIAAYLLAHGALAVVMSKPLLLDLYGSLGVGDAATLNDVAGLFEIGLGALLLLGRAATTPVLLFVVAWKLGTESLHITNGVAGAGWEVIERGGSYAAPLALICLNSIVTQQDTDGARGPLLPPAPALSQPRREATYEAHDSRVVGSSGEQQHRGALPVVAFLAAGFAVSVDVFLTEQWAPISRSSAPARR